MSARYRVGAAFAGVVVLTAAGLVAANWANAESRSERKTAQAGPVDQVTDKSSLVADGLASELGSKAVGSYYDDAGKLVVAVSDLSTAQLVRQAGAIPKLVRFTADQLNAVQAELNRLAAGSSAGKVRSWYVDPISGTVVVTVPKGARDAITERFLERAKENGDQVTIRTVAGRVTTTADDFSLRGGVQVDKNTGYVCSLGFNARTTKGTRIFLTAGHCTAGKPSFSRNGYVLGNTRTSSFPGNDFGTVGVIEGLEPAVVHRGLGGRERRGEGDRERHRRVDAVQVGEEHRLDLREDRRAERDRELRQQQGRPRVVPALRVRRGR